MNRIDRKFVVSDGWAVYRNLQAAGYNTNWL